MASTFKLSEVPLCPHCGAKQEDQAAYYVVPGRAGKDSVSVLPSYCVQCDKPFEAELLSDGTIEFRKVIE